MKAFVASLAALALVKAEADPQFINPYTGMVQAPLVYTQAAPLTTTYVKAAEKVEMVEGDKKVVQYKTGPIAASPFAAPLVYNTAAVNPIVYNTAAVNPLVYTQQVQIAPKYHAKNGEVEHTVYKREAEAEAEAEADPYLLYNNYNAWNGAAPYAAWNAAPYAYRAPLAVQYAARPAVVGAAGTYSNSAFSPYGYAAKGQYAAINPGAAHFAKREAEAEPEADPQFLYPGAYPSVYNGVYGVRAPLTTYTTSAIRPAYSAYATYGAYPYASAFNGVRYFK